VLLFSRTKIGAAKITRFIRGMGYNAAEIHSDRSLGQRREALEGFKRGKYRILVATDIAARGIDVRGIELVINYDLPEDAENYVHRIGRTGRAGAKGTALSFAAGRDHLLVKKIEKFTGQQIAIAEIAGMEGDAPVLKEIFFFKPQGYDADQRIRGTFQATGYDPCFIRQLREIGLETDASLFRQGELNEE